MSRFFFGILVFIVCTGYAGAKASDRTVEIQGTTYPVHPQLLKEKPAIPSPVDSGHETWVLGKLRSGGYVIIPVTVKDGPLNIPRHHSFIGRGMETHINREDFPSLAETGLHDEDLLKKLTMVTGRRADDITRLGRPQGASWSGFVAADETLQSVLIGDNRLVQAMNLRHSDLAKPLFHIWNLVIVEHENNRMAYEGPTIESIFYSGHEVTLQIRGTKAFQYSIFYDNLQCTYDMKIGRSLRGDEEAYIEKRYAKLPESAREGLKKKLSEINIGEILPYYIQRYGFYEGHTQWRADPLAIAFIFGMRSLEELEMTFPGRLNEILFKHFVSEELVH
jgi:hypothetical protein